MSEEATPLGLILGRTTLEYGKLIEKLYQEKGIEVTTRQMIVLGYLSCKDLMIQQDLAEFMHKDKSVVLRIIDSLEEKKLIVRISDPNDRRKKILVLTPSGHALMERAKALEEQVTALVQQGLKEEEITTFMKVANHILTRTKEHMVAKSN